jgi:integrase
MPERYKRNKSGYYRETFVIGKKPDGAPDRVEIRDKDLTVFKRKVEEARRLHARGVELGGTTVYEWGLRWLAVYKANVSDELKAHFKAKLELDIFPAIGSMPIKDVRASHLQALINDSDKGYGTIIKIRIAIRQLFDAAETEGIIERSPARKLELPDNLEEEERRPLTDFECGIVWQVAQSHTAGAYVLTMLLCGLRRGECVGLRIENIDLEQQRFTIQEAIRFRTNQGDVKGPKTKARVRELPIPDILLPFLEEQCEGKLPGDYVFTKVDGSRTTEVTCKWWWKSFMR